MALMSRGRTEQDIFEDGALLSAMIEVHPHDVSGHNSPGRFPFGFVKHRKTVRADKTPIEAPTSNQISTSSSSSPFCKIETTPRGEQAMRTFNDLSRARKRYHDSINFDHSRFPEGHNQVEYPLRASRRAIRQCTASPERCSPTTQTSQPIIPIDSAKSVTETSSPAQKTSLLVEMKVMDRNASSSHHLDSTGKPVQGYESHCSSSETQKYKQRPPDIVTRKTWQKLFPTVIEHNPILLSQGSRTHNTERSGKTEDSGTDKA